MNPYAILLSVFLAVGVGATVWGWLIIARARRTLRWPHVDGIVLRSDQGTGSADLLPSIAYRYVIEGAPYESAVEFPGDLSPSPEFARGYLEKFPAGKAVRVYYDPSRPAHSTLEPGLGRGDWLVFAFGLAMTFGGLLLLLTSIA